MGLESTPEEGFFVIHELRLQRNRKRYPKELWEANKQIQNLLKSS